MFVKMLFGSHLYKLETENSDKDYKGIFLPTREELLLNQVSRTKKESTGGDDKRNTADDVDFEAFSLHEFVRLALAGETVAIDMLHANDEHIVESSDNFPIFQELRKLRTKFYSRDMKAYLGYVRKQAAKYGVKGSRLEVANRVLNKMKSFDPEWRMYNIADQLPITEYSYWINDKDKKTGEDRYFYEVCGRKIQNTLVLEKAIKVVQKIVDGYGDRAKMAETNEGIDWKAVSHSLRAGYQLRDIYRKGDFEYPLDESVFLLNVKCGLLDFKTQVQPELESLVKEVEQYSEISRYPSKPDRKFWNNWLIEKMENHVIGENNVSYY